MAIAKIRDYSQSKKKSLLLNTYYLGTATQTKNKQTKQTKTKQKANKKMADTFLFKGRQELLAQSYGHSGHCKTFKIAQ